MTQPDFSTRRPIAQTRMMFGAIFIGFSALAVFGLTQASITPLIGAVSVILACALLALCWIDLDRYLLLDILTLPLIVSGVTYSALYGVGFWLSVFGGLVGYSVIAGLALYWRRRFGREGIGLGDAKLLAAGGAWIGLFGVPLILLFASGGALLLVGIMALFKQSVGQQTVIPFGPALALAIWAVWCFPGLLP